MIICFIHHPLALTLGEDGSCLLVSLHLWHFLRLGLVVHRGRQLSQAKARVPDLEHDVEDLAIDLPRRRPENIKTSIYELNVATRRCVLQVLLLLLRVLETHHLVWKGF